MDRKQEIRNKCEELASEKAKRIGFASWVDCAKEVLTKEEAEEVKAVWDTMPGYTCWNDALRRWMGDAGRYLRK